MNKKVQQAIEQGYLLYGSQDELHAYGSWCQKHYAPLICAKKRGSKYVTVEMDLIWYGDDDRLARAGFNTDLLFREKLATIYRQVGDVKSEIWRGTFNSVDRVDPRYAEFVAQAFLTIYRQTIGEQATVPAFPEISQDNTLVPRMKQAREQHYARTFGNDGIRWQWEEFCKAYSWPYIDVHEFRRGYVHTVIDMPEERIFSPEVKDIIVQAAHEAGIAVNGDHPIRANTKTWHIHDKGINTKYGHHGALSTESAHFLAENVVHRLSEEGYFQAIDESWHK